MEFETLFLWVWTTTIFRHTHCFFILPELSYWCRLIKCLKSIQMEEPFIMAKTFYTFGTRCPLRTMSSTFLSRPRALAPKGSCTLTSLSWRHFTRQMALPIIGSINSSEKGEHLLFSVFLNGPSGFFKQTSMSFFQPINVTKCLTDHRSDSWKVKNCSKNRNRFRKSLSKS